MVLIKNGSITLHKCKFYDKIPNSITALSIDSDSKLLASANSVGKIDIWNIKENNFHFIKRINMKKSKKIFKLNFWRKEKHKKAKKSFSNYLCVFCETSGLSVICLETLKEKITHNTGGLIYSADFKNYFKNGVFSGRAIVGFNDGKVILLKVKKEVVYKTSFSVSDPKSKINSLSWCPGGNSLKFAAGDSSGTIFIWDAGTKTNLGRITTRNFSLQKQKFEILSLLWIEKNTIISGNSSGETAFWDIVSGTLVTSFKEHGGPILSITKNGKFVYSTGCDSKVVPFFKKVKDSKWAKKVSVRPQKRDILSIKGDEKGQNVFCGGLDGDLTVLFNSSIDCYPAVNGVLKRKYRGSESPLWLKLTKNLSFKMAVSSKRNLLISESNLGLTVWQLENNSVDLANRKKKPKEDRTFSIKTKGEIGCCDVSPNGNLLFFCDGVGDKDNTHLIEIKNLQKVKKLKKFEIPPCCMAKFLSNDKLLIMANDKKSVFEIDLNNQTHNKLRKISKTKEYFLFFIVAGYDTTNTTIADETSIKELKLSKSKKDNNFQMAIFNSDGMVEVYGGDDLNLKKEIKIGKRCAVSAAFSSDRESIFILTSDNFIVALDIMKEKEFEYISKYEKRIRNILGEPMMQYNGIESHLSDPNVLFLYGSKGVLKINFSKPPPPPKSKKSKKLKTNSSQDSLSSSHSSFFSDADDGVFDISNFRAVVKEEVLFFKMLDDSNLAIVEKDVEGIRKKLPKIRRWHRYGK